MERRIDQAFETYPRQQFLPDEDKELAGTDAPVSIGYGQTNSQPSTVRRMLTWLDVQPGNKVLDVGSGSGWTTALLGSLVGERGHVTGVERITALLKSGRVNCKRVGVRNVEFHKAKSDVIGWPENGPYDRILVSAGADTLPDELIEQMGEKGRMVLPIKGSIWAIEKRKDQLRMTEHSGFAFVPLIKGGFV